MNRPILNKPSWQQMAAVFSLMIATLLGFASCAQAANLSASVDRKQIGMEETLTLVLRYDEQVMFGEPDFDALKKDFDILGNRRANQYRSVNGQVESFTQWSLTLAPKKEGDLMIPALEFEGEHSDPIKISVQKTAPISSPDADRPIFLEAEIDKPQVYVQEQLLFTLRLYTSVDLSGLNSEELKVDNALVKQLSENQYQKVVNGQRYGVVEVTYAIFPQQSGSLTLPSVLWNVTQQGRSGFGYDPFLNRNGKRLRLRSEAKQVNVLPSPDHYQGSYWLPAEALELQQSWSRDPQEFRVGEPITRKVQIKARGLMASQIPPLDLATVDGVRYYPDQPQNDESLSAEGVRSVVSESYAIVPSRAGQITLPAVTLHWWDTTKQVEREATLPAETIRVRAAAGTGSTVAPATPLTNAEPLTQASPSTIDHTAKPSGDIWFYAALLLALTNLMFVMMWWRARHSSPPPGLRQPQKPEARLTEKATWRKLKNTLESGDCVQIRDALLAWAQVYLAPEPVHSLQTIAAILPSLRSGIDGLQRALYADDQAAFDANAFKKQLIEARSTAAIDSKGENQLPPLYPTAG